MAKLTDIDKEFIKNNAHNMTDQQLCDALYNKCSVKTIIRAREELKIFKHGGKIAISKHDFDSDLIKEAPIEEQTDAQLRELYKAELINSERGTRIKGMVSKIEWKCFIYEWVEYSLQLEDIVHSESNTIEQMIIIKLRMDENQRQKNSISQTRDELLEKHGITELDLKNLDMDDPENVMIYETCFSANVITTTLNKEYRDLLDKFDKQAQALNATRRQREEKGKIGGETFFTKMKELESRETRRIEGRRAALLKMATDNNMDNLRKGIKYMDDEIAPQLLDAETILQAEQQQKEKENG